jgi:hypothetical protein
MNATRPSYTSKMGEDEMTMRDATGRFVTDYRARLRRLEIETAYLCKEIDKQIDVVNVIGLRVRTANLFRKVRPSNAALPLLQNIYWDSQ